MFLGDQRFSPLCSLFSWNALNVAGPILLQNSSSLSCLLVQVLGAWEMGTATEPDLCLTLLIPIHLLAYQFSLCYKECDWMLGAISSMQNCYLNAVVLK